MDIEQGVAEHYTHGTLAAAISRALAAAGHDPARPTPEILAPIDELHTGGRAATAALFAPLAPQPGQHWLDIGSGLGGPARHLAATFGCRVTGLDLTPELVEVATDLTGRCGLEHLVAFHAGSALAMPFPAASFDGACLLHVGMNIARKAALFAEAHRVLRPGGSFALYEVMRVADGALPFPLPWAGGPDTSFVETPEAYRTALSEAGFAAVSQRDRRDFALGFFRDAAAAVAAHGRPPLGLHVVMGEAAGARIGNIVAAMRQGLIAPIEMIARA